MVEKTIALFLAVAALVGRPCSGFSGRTLTTQHRPIALRRAAPCMSIAVFGATGATGGEVAYQAIKSGTAVTCLCRDPSRLVVPQGSGGNEAGLPLRGVGNIVQGTVRMSIQNAINFVLLPSLWIMSTPNLWIMLTLPSFRYVAIVLPFRSIAGHESS